MAIQATITSIREATPTVKTLTLDLDEPDFQFLAGQWVDFFAEVEGRQEVAGYSMTSSPLRRGTIDLAVKLEGENRVTRWVHSHARPGDRVAVQLGGGFYYHRDLAGSVVLIAGGIGVNPIMSILRYIDHAALGVKATLLYSVRTPEELLFGGDITSIAERHEGVRCLFTVTRPSEQPWAGRTGRIDAEMMQAAAVDPEALFYVCGPPAMMADMVGLLGEIGVPDERILFEWWWNPEGLRKPRGEDKPESQPPE